MVKNPPANAGDTVQSSHGGGNGNPLQYSCLKNLMGRRASQATVHWVTESDMTEAAELAGMFSSVAQHVPYLYHVFFTLISISVFLFLSLSLSHSSCCVFLLVYEFDCMYAYNFFPETLEHNLVTIPFYGTRAFCYISKIQ